MTTTLEKIYLNIIKFGIYGLFFVPLLVSKPFFFPYIFGKAITLRLVVEIITVLFILLVLLNRKYRPKKSYLFWGVVVYMAIKAITTVTGVNPYHSFWSNYERMEGFLTLIHFGLLFVVMSGVFRTKEEWKWVFRLVVLGGFLVALIGIGQKLNLDFVIHAGIAKLDSTIGNSSYVAAYMIYNVFLLLYLFFQDRNIYWRLAYGAVLLIDVLVIFLTTSRGGMVGLLGGLILLSLLVVFFAPMSLIKKNYKYAVSAFIIFLLLSGVFIYVNKDRGWVSNNFVLRKLTSISLSNRTIQDRVINARIGWKGFGDRFLLGWGMENYYVPFNKYYDSRTSEPWFDRAHNIVFDQAVTSGVFGLLAYLFLVFGSIYYLGKRRRRDYLTSFIFMSLIMAAFFANLFVFDNSTTYTIFFTILAFVSFFVFGREELTAGGGWQRQKPVSIFVPVSLGVVLIFSWYFFNIRPAIANNTAIEGYKYSRIDYNKSEQLFKKSLSYKTFGDAEIALRIGDSAMRIIDDEEDKDKAKRAMGFAVEALERAIGQEPLNARYYLYAGNLYTGYFINTERTEENFKKAFFYLEKARELSPGRQEVYYALGQLMMSAGRGGEAINYIQKAVDIKADPAALYNLLLVGLYAGQDYVEQANEVFGQIYNEGVFINYEDDKIEKLVAIYYGRDDFEKIIKILNYMIERRGGNSSYAKTIAKYHGKLAALYKETGEKEKAREHAQTAGELDPDIKATVEDFLETL